MLKGRSLVEPDNFSLSEMENLFTLAEKIEKEEKYLRESCRGKLLASLFFEPSTRTRLSFEAAMLRLGGSYLGFAEPSSSSTTKGESLADTIRTVAYYADAIVMRNPKEGAALLASWAELLSATHTDETLPNPYSADIAFWQKIAGEFTEKTRLMWYEGWFRDYDSVRQLWSSERDVMHLAPIFCGVADQGQITRLQVSVADPPQHSGWAPLSWPPVVMTLLGAAAAADMPKRAAELAYRFIDASYRSTDSRELDEHGGLPGVTREYLLSIIKGKWGEIDYTNAGIEGYGWGALSIHLIIRHLLGLRAIDPTTIALAPTLPQALRRPAANYTIAPIPWGKYLLSFTFRVKDTDNYEAILSVRPRTPAGQQAEQSEMVGEQKHQWEGTWGRERTFQLSHF